VQPFVFDDHSLFVPGCETNNLPSRLSRPIAFASEAVPVTSKMDDKSSPNFYSKYQLKQLQYENVHKQEYQHPSLSITSVMTAYSKDYRLNRSNLTDDMQNPISTDLCRMMEDCKMETDIPTYQCYPLALTPEHTDNDFSDVNNLEDLRSKYVVLDKLKACSWDKLDSMHTTTRRSNRVSDDEARLWNNLESVHSMKALSRSDSRCGAESSQSLSSSFNDQDMLQGSNSDYNDSMCSFASFGETSFSDNIDTATTSLQVASKIFTRSFDSTCSNNEAGLQSRIPRQPMMQRGISYRSCGNSLSQIQETSMDL
jgi:hypothetical protein